MKWNCGPSWEEKHETRQQWHPWFAWHPVRVGTGDCRWFEYVDRKVSYSDFPFMSPFATWLSISKQYRPRT
jgi:hypothetical protein